MWWYNILGNNEGIISYLLWLDTITAEYILITTNLVEMKRENDELILTVKIIGLSKFIDYYGLSIEVEP